MLCVLFCFFSLSLSSSAAGDDTVLYGMTHDELLQFGYEYENGVYTLPSGIIPPEAYFPATMLIEEPHYPDIDPRKLPWSTMPSYIQDIVYMGIEGAATTDVDDYKMPFVACRVNANRILVFVGLNCGLGVISNTRNMRVCFINPEANNSVPTNSYCYYANFNLSYEQTSDWVKASASDWGSTGNVKSYSTGTFIATDFNVDLYLYGGNGVFVGDSSSVFAAASTSEGGTTNVNFPLNNDVGFISGRYFSNFNSDFLNVYVQTFTPPTPEEVEQETQKGIFETLKSIPDTIAEKFKGLFIPEEGYFDTYIQEYQDYFSERFGLLYEIPDSIADIFQQLIDFNPAEEGYYIDFPEVVMPVLENGEWRNVVLIEDTKVTFDFLDEGPIATLYSMYRAALWLLFIFLLINLIIRKSDKVFGGGSG